VPVFLVIIKQAEFVNFPARLSFLDISDLTRIYIYAVFDDPGGVHLTGLIHSSFIFVACPGAPVSLDEIHHHKKEG
jgi:hypothetical protein